MKEIKRKDELVKIIEKYFTEDDWSEFTIADIVFYAFNYCTERCRGLPPSSSAKVVWKVRATELYETYELLDDLYWS